MPSDAVRELIEAFKVASHYMDCYHTHFPTAGAWFKMQGDCAKESDRLLAAADTQPKPDVEALAETVADTIPARWCDHLWHSMPDSDKEACRSVARAVFAALGTPAPLTLNAATEALGLALIGAPPAEIDRAEIDCLRFFDNERTRRGLEKRSAWRPIESAPRDGTVVILLDGELAICGMFFLVNDHDRHPWKFLDPQLDDDGFINGTYSPTHWQPLPAPPDCGLPIKLDKEG
jgi:hypothetical protein